MMNSNNRIVVTGMGTVSSYGVNDEALWAAIRKGASPSFAPNSNCSENPKVVRVENFQASDLLGKKGLQFMHPCSLFLSAASILALRDAAIEMETINPDRLGVVVSTNYSGFKMSSQYDKTTITEGPRYVSPLESPNTLGNSPASYLAIRIQSRALNTTISTGACAGLDALGYAIFMLRNKKADTIVVGGTEEWNDEINWYYKNAGLIPQKDFEMAGEVFNSQSSGVIPGEGSCAVVLERLEDAIGRGATILGEVVSWNTCFSPMDNHNARVRGFVRCMNNTIQKSNLTTNQVDLIVSGANGLPEQDKIEWAAIHETLGNDQTPIAAIKRTTGETSGASGLFQLFTSIHAIKNKIVPNNSLHNSHSNQIRNVLLTANDVFGGVSSVLVKEIV